MKRFILAALLVLCAAPAWAQLGLGVFPAPRYFGPCDVATPTAYWGLRACGASQLTGSVNAIRLRRASDSTEQDIVILATGDLDVASASTFCNATSCFVRTLYAQVGTTACGGATCNLVQATAGNQPAFTFNCIGSKPCIQPSLSASSFLLSANNMTPATGVVSLYAGGGRTTGTQTVYVVRQSSGNAILGRNGVANSWALNGGSSGQVIASAVDGSFHAAVGVINGSSSLFLIDSTLTAGTATGNTTAGTPDLTQGNTASVASAVDGAVWDNTVLTRAQGRTLVSQSKGYWGF